MKLVEGGEETGDARFNLLYEPWILVTNVDGKVEELDLLDTFGRAHEIKCISGELPTQDIAVFRLLLAVMYAIYQRTDCHGNPSRLEEPREALDRWADLWNAGRFNIDHIKNYLRNYKDRFYLMHPERPFYQVNFHNGTEYGSSKLIGELSESSNKPRLFPVRTGKGRNRISYSEAARWLLYLNSYDDTSSKPTRGLNLPSVGAGWLGKLGLVYVTGSSLFETLLLNFVLLDGNEMPFAEGRACWELETVRCEERTEISVPDNPLELLTLQSRRLILLEDAGAVVGFRLLGGDVFSKENAFVEQMTMWRKDEKTDEFKPRRHDPSRALWRDYSALISRGDQKGQPGIVRWTSLLQREGVLTRRVLKFQTASVKYGDKDFFVNDVFEDSISMNADLLAILGDEWNPRIDVVLSKTEKCVLELGKFAINILRSSGNDDENSHKGASAAVREKAYFILDVPFRQWLGSIDPSKDDLEVKTGEWLNLMRDSVLNLGERCLMDAGERSLIGKSMTIGKKEMSSMKNNAASWFGFFKNEVHRICGE